MKIPPSLRAAAAAAIPLALLASAARADDDAFEFYKEEAQVVTASKRAEPAWRAPVAVDVITAEDIRAYGFRDLWDALRYRAGMSVVDGRSLDGNRALVSARGFDNEFVNEMQVLVDGRSAYSPLLGGTYWQNLPVQMQDIERIEIVRGPNAALYGSNAGLGVINIITKRPGSATSGSALISRGSRTEKEDQVAAETGGADAGIRVSYERRLDDGHPAASGATSADDYLHLNKFNARGRWTPWARTEIEASGGSAWTTAGIPGLSGPAQAHQSQNFEMLHATRRLDGGGSVEATLSRAETALDLDPLFAGDVEARMHQYDADLLHRFSWLDGRVDTVWGADFREAGADSNQAFPATDPTQKNRLARGYMDHTVRLSDALTATAGLSLEHSTTGGTQPAWQAALIAVPIENHSLRASYSYATTLPPLLEQRANYSLGPGKLYSGNPNFGPERISSWEVGWSSKLLDGALRPSLSLYYMRILDLGVLNATAGGPGVILQTANGDEASARGAEASLEYALAPGRVAFANYTYERIADDHGASASGYDAARTTPRHSVNLGGRAALPRGFTVSSLVGYKDNYEAVSTSRGTVSRVPRHFRVDARVSWDPTPNWELFVAGEELLQKSFSEYVDGTATPRLVRGGVSARFGR